MESSESPCIHTTYHNGMFLHLILLFEMIDHPGWLFSIAKHVGVATLYILTSAINW